MAIKHGTRVGIFALAYILAFLCGITLVVFFTFKEAIDKRSAYTKHQESKPAHQTQIDTATSFTPNDSISQPSDIKEDQQVVDNVSDELVSLMLKEVFPQPIARYIDLFGRPDSVSLPHDADPSPWGQWFVWYNETLNLEITALGSDYSPTFRNDTAKCGLLVIEPMNISKETGMSIPLGLQFGQTIDSLKKAITQLDFDEYELITESDYISNYSVSIRDTNGRYIVLFADTQGLNSVAISAFDVLTTGLIYVTSLFLNVYIVHMAVEPKKLKMNRHQALSLRNTPVCVVTNRSLSLPLANLWAHSFPFSFYSPSSCVVRELRPMIVDYRLPQLNQYAH